MSAAAAAVSLLSQSASPDTSQRSQPPATFSALHNLTQVNPARAADMSNQSLTQSLAVARPGSAHQQFFEQPAVQQRLAAACKEFSDASTALKAARAGRERFVSACNKNGATKKLPAKLQWGLSKAAHLSLDAVQSDFYAAEQKQLIAIEREASDKAYDALLAAKDKHIDFLASRCNTRTFVTATEQTFAVELQRIADYYDRESQADSLAASQAAFAFPRAAVATYFSEELHRRLQALHLAAVSANSAEQQRIAADLAAENQSKETVLAGAHTGETLSRLAEQAAKKLLAPIEKKFDRLLEQMQQRQLQQPLPHKHHGHQPPHHRSLHADASSSSSARTQQPPATHRGQARRIDVNAAGHKRLRRDEQLDDKAIAPPSFTVSIPDDPPPTAKRPKTVVFARQPKNGTGGDRSHRQDQQQPRSAQPANAHRHEHARNQGRGPRSDDQQLQQHQ